MDSKLRISMAKDRKQLKASGNMGTQMYVQEMRKAIDAIRIRYAGMIIKRTLHSVDHAGHRISGLEPYHEHFIKVALYPKEMENLEALSQDLVRDGTHKVAQLARGSVSPASLSRLNLLIICFPGFLPQNPTSSNPPKLQCRVPMAQPINVGGVG